MTFVAFLAGCLALVGAIGWFYGRQSVKEESLRRWGEKLRKEIEDAGGLEAWKKRKARTQAPAPPGPVVIAKAARASGLEHPLDGTLLTSRGVWTVVVLTDEDDGRTRRFAVNLVPPNAREADAVPLIVRVPLVVIASERPQSWAADLRNQFAGWIGSNVIERGEMIWWPDAAAGSD